MIGAIVDFDPGFKHMGIGEIETQRFHVEFPFHLHRVVAVQAVVVQKPVDPFGNLLGRQHG